MHTMSEDVSASMQLSSLRAELACPANDWESAWQIERQNMLGPSLTTFLFKLLHQILPTAERVSRILANQYPRCTRCRLNPPATETLTMLCLTVRQLDLYCSMASQVLTLNINPSEELSFPLVMTIAHFLSSLFLFNPKSKKGMEGRTNFCQTPNQKPKSKYLFTTPEDENIKATPTLLLPTKNSEQWIYVILRQEM